MFERAPTFEVFDNYFISDSLNIVLHPKRFCYTRFHCQGQQKRWHPPTSDIDLLAEWKEYFSSLLNNSNGQSPSELPQPAAKVYQGRLIHQHERKHC